MKPPFLSHFRRWISWRFIEDHVAGHIIVWPFFGLIGIVFGYIQKLELVTNDPYRFVFLFILAGVSFNGLVRIRKKTKEYLNNRDIIKHTGLICFLACKDEKENYKAWNIIADDVEKMSGDLRILGSTGGDTFSKINAPLHEAINNYHGPEIKILLLKKDSKYIKACACRIQINPQNYIDEIENSIKYCREMREKGVRVKIKLYEQAPIWKMIITNKHLWLKYYDKTFRVEQTPFYCFSVGVTHEIKPSSLYFQFLDVFEEIWSDPSSVEVDLNG